MNNCFSPHVAGAKRLSLRQQKARGRGACVSDSPRYRERHPRVGGPAYSDDSLGLCARAAAPEVGSVRERAAAEPPSHAAPPGGHFGARGRRRLGEDSDCPGRRQGASRRRLRPPPPPCPAHTASPLVPACHVGRKETWASQASVRAGRDPGGSLRSFQNGE